MSELEEHLEYLEMEGCAADDEIIRLKAENADLISRLQKAEARAEKAEGALLDVAIGICETSLDVIWAFPDQPMNNTTAFDLICTVLGVEILDEERPVDAVRRARNASRVLGGGDA